MCWQDGGGAVRWTWSETGRTKGLRVRSALTCCTAFIHTDSMKIEYTCQGRQMGQVEQSASGDKLIERGARSGKAGSCTRAVGLERGSTARSYQLSRQGKIDDEINQPPEIASCHIHAQPTPSTCLAPPLSLFEEPRA